MSTAAYLARADALTVKLLGLLDAKPSIDPVAVERARVELAAVQQMVAMEQQKITLEQTKELHKAAMERERKGLHNVEFERELLELKKAQLSHPSKTSVLTAAAASGAPLRPTRRSRSRSTGVHTPPPPLSVAELDGLDQDDNIAASATAAAATASFSSMHASAGDFQQVTAKIMASLRADLLKQQIEPTAATAAGTTGPVVEVDVACRSMNATLTTLESRLARYRALEQRLTAASDLDHVELNVGGERFHTTVATLCKEPSYLQGMFSGCVVGVY
jgi:hypothetical protein